MRRTRKIVAAIGALAFAVTLSLSAFVISDNSVVRAAEDGVQMYRMYNPSNGEHLHTQDVNERNVLTTQGWNYEGVSFIVADSGSPVYRLFNRYSGEHHYTMDEGEKDWLTSLGWNYEGIGWYSNKTGDECEIAVYRLFNPYSTDAINSHHYTIDEGERDWLTSLGWNYEGTSWVSMHEVHTDDILEATCVSTGYSGDAKCATCNKVYTGSLLPINPNNHKTLTYVEPVWEYEYTQPVSIIRCNHCGQEMDGTFFLFEHECPGLMEAIARNGYIVDEDGTQISYTPGSQKKTLVSGGYYECSECHTKIYPQ